MVLQSPFCVLFNVAATLLPMRVYLRGTYGSVYRTATVQVVELLPKTSTSDVSPCATSGMQARVYVCVCVHVCVSVCMGVCACASVCACVCALATPARYRGRAFTDGEQVGRVS